jgi:hypothetical protein
VDAVILRRRASLTGRALTVRSVPSAQLRSPISRVGIGGGVEDLGCDRVHASAFPRSASGQPAVYVLWHPEQKLLHELHAITSC